MLRLNLASLVCCGTLQVLHIRYQWNWRTLPDFVVLGLLNIGLPFLCLALAIGYISSGLAAILFNTFPMFTIVLAHYFLPDEKLNWIKLAGTAVAVVGATILVLSNASGLALPREDTWIGQLLILLSSLLGAAGVIFARRRMRDTNAFVMAAGQAVTSLALILPLGLIVEGIPSLNYAWPAWAAALAAAVAGPVISFWLLFYIMNKYSASLAGFSMIITPFFSVLIGVFFLGEVLSPPLAFGTLVLLLGVTTLQYF